MRPSPVFIIRKQHTVPVSYSQVANPSVRANAAAILFDVFPLNDLNANVAQSDELLQRQFDVIGVSNITHACYIGLIYILNLLMYIHMCM